jgi:hypothetical protein
MSSRISPKVRHARTQGKRDSNCNTIVAHILNLDVRNIGATRTIVAEMASHLRAARGEGPVGKHYVDRFNARTTRIKLRSSRLYSYQRALKEDADVIEPCFELVRKTKEKYSILDEGVRYHLHQPSSYNSEKVGLFVV